MKAAIYCRVSTHDQNVGSQLLDLRRYVKDRNWTVLKEYRDEGISGRRQDRPGLSALLSDAQQGRFNVVVVAAFDRVARSTKNLILTMEALNEAGVMFVSCRENLDTSGAVGQALVAIIGAMGQLEHHAITERVRAGLRRARSEGRRLGRPVVATDDERLRQLAQSGKSLREISRQTGVSATTIARRLKAAPQRS